MVLALIQWILDSQLSSLLSHGQILNQTVLRRQLGIQARQGNSQNHLKGSESLEGNHPDPFAKADLVP